MNYKSFNLGDWIGHISGVIEDETTLDGNEMRDLVVFLTTLNQQPCEDCISREAVLDALHVEGRPTKKFDYVIAVKKDIMALPPVTPKQQPCDDCISRQKVVKLLSYDWATRPAHKAVESVRNLPSVTPKEKTGCWIGIDEEPHEDWECDNCGFVIWADENIEKFHYCPNCGRKMIEPQESEG